MILFEWGGGRIIKSFHLNQFITVKLVHSQKMKWKSEKWTAGLSAFKWRYRPRVSVTSEINTIWPIAHARYLIISTYHGQMKTSSSVILSAIHNKEVDLIVKKGCDVSGEYSVSGEVRTNILWKKFLFVISSGRRKMYCIVRNFEGHITPGLVFLPKNPSDSTKEWKLNYT